MQNSDRIYAIKDSELHHLNRCFATVDAACRRLREMSSANDELVADMENASAAAYQLMSQIRDRS